MKIFSFFKLSRKDREKVQQPKDSKTWLIHGISEFIGTFILTLGLAGLSTVARGDGKAVEEFLGHPTLVGFYAGFGVVGFVLFVFLRWSCDLNPAVTMYRMLNGTNTTLYGVYKIVIQFASSILCGVLIYYMGHAHGAMNANNEVIANHAVTLEGVWSKYKNWPGAQNTEAAKALIIFGTEFVVTAVLLFSIFSKSINDKYRDFMIIFIISIDVYFGMVAGSAGLNPSRALAQQLPGLIWGPAAGGAASAHSLSVATGAMVMGSAFAPMGYLFIQGLSEHYINPGIKSIIEFKNFKADNMKTG